MADWNPPSDDHLASGMVGLSAHIIAIRDLPEALARRAPRAPWVNAVGAVEVFKSNQTWTVPDGVFRVKVTAIGGGGAGGAGLAMAASPNWVAGAGGGGGAGALLLARIVNVVPGDRAYVIVGTGGIGKEGAGGDGEDTHIDIPRLSSIVAHGGKGGTAGLAQTPGLGGAGGDATDPHEIPGAAGHDRYLGGQPNFYEATASGAGAASAFGSGASRSYYDSTGRDAVVPGSGGGGGVAGQSSSGPRAQRGGHGAPGLVIIEY